MTLQRGMKSIWRSAILIMVLALQREAFGQASFEGQIRGEVHDATGAVIVGAKITATDVSTGISNSTQTDDRGSYIFNGLRPGNYSIRVSASGFRSGEADKVVLTVSQHTSIDFKLQVAGTDS